MSVKKNLFFNMLYQALNMVLPLITAPYLARVIGAKGTGIFSYYYSIAGYFVLFGMLGINNYGNRSIAMSRDDKKEMSKKFWGIYCVQLISGVTSSLAYIVFIQSIHSGYKIVAWLNIFYVVSSILDINWFFFGLEEFKWISIRNAIIKILSVIFILVLVKEKNDIYIYILIMSMSIFFSQIVLWPKAIKMLYFERPSWCEIKTHIKPILVLFIPVVAVSLYKMMDKVMLGGISTKIQSGLYENAEKIINIPIVFVNALGTVMLPKMSNLLMKGEKEKSRQYIRDSMQFTMFLALAVAAGTAAIAKNFAPVFFGDEFIDCGKLMICLSPITVFISWANVIRTQYLIPNKKDKEYIFSVIFGAIVNICINLVLIGQLGALGACIGTVFAEMSVMIIQTIAVRKELELKKYLKDSWIFLVAGNCMLGIVFYVGKWIGASIHGLILQFLIGVLIYSAISGGMYYIFYKQRFKYIILKVLNGKFNKRSPI